MKKLCMLLAALIFSGCAHAPADQAKDASPAVDRKFSSTYLAQTIVKGKTTEKEVIEKIGAPNAVERRALGQTAGPAQVWRYWSAPPLQAVGKGGLFPVSRTTITFDDNGVVQDYQAADSSVLIR